MSDQARSLDEHLASEFEIDPHVELDKPENERFTVDDERKAEWALRRLAEIRSEKSRAESFAEERIARIIEWRDGETDRLGSAESFFLSLLEGYHRTLLDENERKKTVRLPAGTLKLRKSPDSIDVLDEKAFLQWAKANAPELVRVKESADKAAIRKAVVAPSGGFDAARVQRAVTADGELLPGISIELGALKFSVDTEVS